MLIYDHPDDFTIESGHTFHGLRIAYDTFGTLSPERDNVVWVMHALTANSDVADWWPHTVEKGKFLDSDKYFIVCANVLGGCYGSTGPLTENPETGKTWHADFPKVTVRDMMECHRLLARHLGIDRIHTMIGASLGGFQALEWLAGHPKEVESAVLIATDVECRPWEAAFNEAMYMAIEADPTYGDPSPDAGQKGLASARAMALISYRGHYAYNLTQQDPEERPDLFSRRVHSYQRYQGKKLTDRFNVYSYMRVCQSADSHDIGRGRGGVEKALQSITAKCLVVTISSDILFPPEYAKVMTDNIRQSEYVMLDSLYAHDGFLIEHEKLDAAISAWRKNNDIF